MIGACSRSADPVIRRVGMPDVSGVKSDDREMNTAILQARQSVGQFIERLQSPPPAQTRASLKVPLVEGGQVEHVWLTDVRYTSGRLWGRINNYTAVVTSWGMNDSVSVAPDEISDWMAVDSGRLVGGYTIRQLGSRMPPEERAAFDQELGFRVESGTTGVEAPNKRMQLSDAS
jgi:uncharacterized protein YegJ (DUF2314 family)